MDSEKNRSSRPGIRFVFLRQEIQLTELRSILTSLLANSRRTVIRGLMTDEEGAIFVPLLTTPCSRGGRPPKNRRHRLDGILWICRTGAPWRDVPAVFGKWNSVWKQFRRWCESGAWDLLRQALADSGGALDMVQMIDSTSSERIAAPREKRLRSRIKHSAVRAAGSAPRSTCVATPQVSPSGSYSARTKPMT